MASTFGAAWKGELRDHRNDFQDRCLRRSTELTPAGCRVIFLVDRGLGDRKLLASLADMGFGHVIRFRRNIHLTDAGRHDEALPPSGWGAPGDP